MWPAVSWAHNPFTSPEQTATVLSAVVLLVYWLIYLVGCVKRRPSTRDWWLFNAGGLICVATVFGPLDHWAETNEAAHMVQHMLMMVVIAPLWVMARPIAQWQALSPSVTQWIVKPLGFVAQHPLLAAAIHGAVIWVWHIPRLYTLALDNLWWHAFEHFCFLLSAGLFWWAVLRSQQKNTGAALLALLATLMHTGFLGALMTFSQSSWYGSDRLLEHQQLAGLLMWVLGGVPYISTAFYLGWRGFKRLSYGE
ncbi:cytochrome c oxidase assembly protein [Gilvimarinus sp. DA14]|uniref:cytochrome c oxidase assembly protein n=1 Tax=Gilvimarinus sp. DA14 TaxID=2956798 RepID=UPI0020B72E92|nr:cytochrome c oxidase assembly protein [Gilvimarinus sp. DA14]UTF60207.1 cytochrome c oxidase assembly protein [Gilvimarinus sp. DA14]